MGGDDVHWIAGCWANFILSVDWRKLIGHPTARKSNGREMSVAGSVHVGADCLTQHRNFKPAI